MEQYPGLFLIAALTLGRQLELLANGFHESSSQHRHRAATLEIRERHARSQPRIDFQNTLTYPNAPAGPAQVNGKPYPPCHDRDKSRRPLAAGASA
jgi:hypothetical protein